MMTNIPIDLEMRLRNLRDSSVNTSDVERRTQSLERVQLSQGELLEYGKQSADAQCEIKQLEADLSSVKKQLQARIEGHAAVIDQKSEAIRGGYESRMVECVDVLEFPKRGRKTTFRLDTLEPVSEALMSENELQRMLKLEDDQKAKAAKEAAEPKPEPVETAEETGEPAASDEENTAAEEHPEQAEPAAKKLPRMPRPKASI